MSKKPKDEYVVLFRGAKLSKKEANKAGLGLIFGLLGAIISAFFFGPEHKILSVIIITVLAAIGYFWVGNKILKHNE